MVSRSREWLGVAPGSRRHAHEVGPSRRDVGEVAAAEGRVENVQPRRGPARSAAPGPVRGEYRGRRAPPPGVVRRPSCPTVQHGRRGRRGCRRHPDIIGRETLSGYAQTPRRRSSVGAQPVLQPEFHPEPECHQRRFAPRGARRRLLVLTAGPGGRGRARRTACSDGAEIACRTSRSPASGPPSTMKPSAASESMNRACSSQPS